MPSSPDASQLLRSKSLILTERILGLCDQTGIGQTRGCFDRHYWCYKLHDVANARFQEAVHFLTLARDHLNPDAGPAINQIISDGVSFWTRARNTDGSVNEVYPYERSFCATSMSAQAVAEACLRIPEIKVDGLHKTANWLVAHESPELANQMAGACLALQRLSVLMGEERYAQAARAKFDCIAERQLDNGCYSEYGGPDIGYATITLSLLANYHQLAGGDDVLESMSRCAAYIDELTFDNGLYDWADMSRRTQFLYPFGLSYLASPVFDKLLKGLKENVVISPLWMDDRYCIPLATDYLLSAQWLDEKREAFDGDDTA